MKHNLSLQNTEIRRVNYSIETMWIGNQYEIFDSEDHIQNFNILICLASYIVEIVSYSHNSENNN